MAETITIGEIRDLIRHEKIPATDLFSKEDFQNCKPLIKAMAEKQELEDYRAEKDKKKKEDIDVDSMIPTDKPDILTAEQKKKQDEEDKFIPDDDKPGDDNDLIPD